MIIKYILYYTIHNDLDNIHIMYDIFDIKYRIIYNIGVYCLKLDIRYRYQRIFETNLLTPQIDRYSISARSLTAPKSDMFLSTPCQF